MHRRTSLLIAFFAAVSVAAPLAAQAPVRQATLAQAVEAALRIDPAAVAAESDVSTARAEILETRGAWLPTLTLNSTYSNSSNERFDQSTGRLSSENYTAQLATGIELFDGGRRFAERRSANALLRAADAGLVEQRFVTVLTVKESFYGAAAAVELLGAARQRLERAQQQLSFARTRLELGTATRSDVLRAELEVGNAELAVVDAESALRSARLQLGRRMGVAGEVQPEGASLPERGPARPSPEEIAERAVSRSPSVRAARARADERRANRFASYSTYAPSVRATFGYDWAATEFPPTERDWSMRVTASLPVLNGFAREGNVARARAQERAAEAAAADAALAARAAATDAAREINQAERRVEISRRAVELAQEDLRVQEERYRLGNATILDLQTSQEALAQAEAAWVTARQALALAVAQLEAVLGEELGAVAAETAEAAAPGND
jgi:outer membrane protein